jgi:hypothetical protein
VGLEIKIRKNVIQGQSLEKKFEKPYLNHAPVIPAVQRSTNRKTHQGDVDISQRQSTQKGWPQVVECQPSKFNAWYHHPQKTIKMCALISFGNLYI